MRHYLISGLLSFCLLLSSSLKANTEHQIDPNLLQRIRQFLGIIQPIEAGGSRGRNQKICVISPFVISPDQVVISPTDKPFIHISQPLNELRIATEDGLTTWEILGSSTSSVKGFIQWPINPIQPGQRWVMIMRPRGASGGDVAQIMIEGADRNAMEQTKSLLTSVNGNPKKWEKALTEALNRKDFALAIILINRSHLLSSASKIALNELIAKEACQRKSSKQQTSFNN